MRQIDLLATSIQRQEGWVTNSLSHRNNNPGNLRFAGQKGAVKGKSGFAIFDTYENGYAALCEQIKLDASRGLDFSGFLHKFAPPSENDTIAYIRDVCGWCHTTPETKLSEFLVADSEENLS